MQRLEDVLEKDLSWIFYEARDFTRQTLLQIANEKFTIMASLQSSDMEFSASEKAINAYKIELLIREKDISNTAKKKLSKDAILYVDGTAYKVIDTDVCRGVIAMSLERGTARGGGISGREL